MIIEQKLASAGIELLETVKPVANYVPARTCGDLVYLSGHGPVKTDGSLITGKLGIDLDIEDGYGAARLAAVALLSSLKAEIGDLDRVTGIIKLLGLVNCPPDFYDQPRVINGASDLMVSLFEENGRHARSAVGAAALPLNMAVEIEMIVSFK